MEEGANNISSVMLSGTIQITLIALVGLIASLDGATAARFRTQEEKNTARSLPDDNKIPIDFFV